MRMGCRYVVWNSEASCLEYCNKPAVEEVEGKKITLTGESSRTARSVSWVPVCKEHCEVYEGVLPTREVHYKRGNRSWE